MQYLADQRSSHPAAEPISLGSRCRPGFRAVAVFLICAGLLLATFAVGGVWLSREGNAGGFWQTLFSGSGEACTEGTESTDGEGSSTPDSLPVEPEPTLPTGAVPIRAVDLSCLALGKGYLHNGTAFTPDTEALLRRDVSSPVGPEPLVLVLHTHTSEAYLPDECDYLASPVGDATYSRDDTRNVLAAGRELCRVLNLRGIPTLHCLTAHDTDGIGSAYERSSESIRFYRERYPSIRYVIDLHRDAITDADGNYLRAVTTENEKTTAQVMAVVGSSGSGEEHPEWEGNLALALQLRSLLNAEGGAVCRPVTLRNATYNQELAPMSILLEIGTGGNSVEEAVRAAELVGEALAVLLRGQ